MRKRGRPSHSSIAELAKQNHAIGRAIFLLAMTGYPRRGARGIYATMAKVALEVFPSSERCKLSSHRVEEIYEAWLLDNPWFRHRINATRESLKRLFRPPGETLHSLASALVQNNGEFPRERFSEVAMRPGYLELTDAGIAEQEHSIAEMNRRYPLE